MQRDNSFEKTLMLGKTEDKRRKGWQRMRWLDKITNSMDEFEQTLGDSGEQRSLACYHPWGLNESDRTLDWTTTITQAQDDPPHSLDLCYAP